MGFYFAKESSLLEVPVFVNQVAKRIASINGKACVLVEVISDKVNGGPESLCIEVRKIMDTRQLNDSPLLTSVKTISPFSYL